MFSAISVRNITRPLPGFLPLAVAFLLPFAWWPTEQVFLGIALYAPLLVGLVVASCWLSELRSRTGGTAQFRGAAILAALFGGFVLYVWLYRTLCL